MIFIQHRRVLALNRNMHYKSLPTYLHFHTGILSNNQLFNLKYFTKSHGRYVNKTVRSQTLI